MNHLTRSDYAQALVVLSTLESACADPGSFANAAVQALNEFVPSELVTLSVRSLESDHHDVAVMPAAASGADRAVAVPLFVDEHTLVSIVLNRSATEFGARDCERLELLRPHLAFLYQEACRAGRRAQLKTVVPALPATLTARESEVVRWLAAGKTDAEIAALLSISVRTVQKHLEHVYVKLGVETRTAAVMRALGDGLRPASALASNL